MVSFRHAGHGVMYTMRTRPINLEMLNHFIPFYIALSGVELFSQSDFDIRDMPTTTGHTLVDMTRGATNIPTAQYSDH